MSSAADVGPKPARTEAETAALIAKMNGDDDDDDDDDDESCEAVIDKEKLVDNIDSIVTCRYCLCLLRFPHTMGGCAHAFCYDCAMTAMCTEIKKVERGSMKKKAPMCCPVCNKGSSPSALVYNQGLDDVSMALAASTLPQGHIDTMKTDARRMRDRKKLETEERSKKPAKGGKVSSGDNAASFQAERDRVARDEGARRAMAREKGEVTRRTNLEKALRMAEKMVDQIFAGHTSTEAEGEVWDAYVGTLRPTQQTQAEKVKKNIMWNRIIEFKTLKRIDEAKRREDEAVRLDLDKIWVSSIPHPQKHAEWKAYLDKLDDAKRIRARRVACEYSDKIRASVAAAAAGAGAADPQDPPPTTPPVAPSEADKHRRMTAEVEEGPELPADKTMRWIAYLKGLKPDSKKIAISMGVDYCIERNEKRTREEEEEADSEAAGPSDPEKRQRVGGAAQPPPADPLIEPHTLQPRAPQPPVAAAAAESISKAPGALDAIRSSLDRSPSPPPPTSPTLAPPPPPPPPPPAVSASASASADRTPNPAEVIWID
jgi:hypothetical protein